MVKNFGGQFNAQWQTAELQFVFDKRMSCSEYCAARQRPKRNVLQGRMSSERWTAKLPERGLALVLAGFGGFPALAAGSEASIWNPASRS
jgi:hypothetical protein